MEFYTIGVFGSTEELFFNKLKQNKIDIFCDIRQRRGVRGSKYSFVNSKRLQVRLEEMNISYLAERGLAPTKQIRNFQAEKDLQEGISKQNREELGNSFISEYHNQILNTFDFKAFLYKLSKESGKRIVFFCVEENPSACHRSLVTRELNENYNFYITHL